MYPEEEEKISIQDESNGNGITSVDHVGFEAVGSIRFLRCTRKRLKMLEDQ